jgi:UDP-glucose 4-epimerase
MSEMRVVITGAAGYLGEALAQRCVAAGAEVLGLDIREPGSGWPALAAFNLQDVTAESLSEKMESFSPDVLVHLAWVFDPTHHRERERDVDLGGTENAFRAAIAAGASRIVYPSSTTAYGVDPQRRRLMREEDGPLAHAAYPYAYYKARVEEWLPQFIAAHPDTDFVVLRPCIVIGPRARNVVTTVAEGPLMVRISGYDPPVQFLHEEDAEEVFWRSIVDAPPGTYNVAGGGVMRYSEICRAAGRTPVPLPAALVYPLVAAAWFLRLLPYPAGLLDFIRYPWVAETDRLVQEFGYKPRYSTREAFASYVESRARRAGG